MRVVSVNVGTPREVEWMGRVVTTAIWKHPVTGPVRVEGVNLIGDDQADRRVHGGDDKAVYAYSVEDYAWFGVAPGSFGENLTTEGIDLNGCVPGDRWRVGSVTLEVAQPREPCYKLGIRMNDQHFPGRFEDAGRPGAYLRIVESGELAAGDAIAVTPTHEPRITLGEMVQPMTEQQWDTIATDDRFSDNWHRRAQRVQTRAHE